jgi:hypothetical protein
VFGITSVVCLTSWRSESVARLFWDDAANRSRAFQPRSDYSSFSRSVSMVLLCIGVFAAGVTLLILAVIVFG